MNRKAWLTASQNTPPVSWNGQTKTFAIVLMGLDEADLTEGVEVEWKPPITYVVRIRETSSGKWSCGFETPLTGCGFVNLKPDTEYEIEVRSKNEHGESGPVMTMVRTNAEGSLGV